MLQNIKSRLTFLIKPKKSELAYWARFYRSGKAPEEPSLFAVYVMNNYAYRGAKMIEFGCGNGRDARYFAQKGLYVTATDICESEIENLDRTNRRRRNLQYKFADFTNLPSKKRFDIVYSRFTLHSVDAAGQQRALEWAFRNLSDNGKICIETRGQKNELYKKGKVVEGEKDAYIYEEHYRRFVNFSKFKKDIQDAGFSIIEAAEDTGFAPYENTDFHFIRIIATKLQPTQSFI